MVTMVKRVMLAGLVMAACGGGKQASTTPVEPDDEAPVVRPANNPNMVPPEKMDEINRILERKQRAVARCLADVVERGDLPKRSRGKLTVQLTIATSGVPEQVSIIKSQLDSQAFNTCVIEQVKGFRFPELPRPFPTSYTYAAEAM